MRESKLVLSIRSLDEKETAQFHDFINSSFFNQREDVCQLLSNILDPENDLNKKNIHSQIYPDADYSDVRIRLLMSDTFRLLDKFLAYREFSANESVERLYSLRAYRKRRIKRSFEIKLSGAKKKLSSHQYKDSEFLWFQHMFESEKNLYLQDLKIRDKEPNLQSTMDSLDHVFIAKKVKYLCQMLNYEKVQNSKFNVELEDPVIKLIRESSLDEIPAIGIYFYLYNTMKHFDEDHYFHTTLDKIRKHWSLFSSDEAGQLFLICINYCIKKILSGNKQYEQLMLDIYKEMINNDIILENGVMSPWLYKNVTSIGLRLNQTEWTLQFLNDYKEDIDPEFIDNAYIYNLAKVYFHKGEFVKVIETLRSVEYNDLFYALDVRAMLLKTYFELREFVVMNSLASSFRQFVRRQTKLPEAHKKNYFNLISFTRKAAKAYYKDGRTIKRLIQQLQETESISDKKWLVRKLEEMHASSRKAS
ncbi:MAG: hypothetical protein HKN22_02290 [Bacteroidia bacterium]|nr:hypothetical protein [Bacteroidia bacterium]